MGLEVVEEAGSTSSVLKARAEAGGGEQALMARRQTQGRGQSGRAWQSPEGNLHLSVLLRPGALRWPGHWSILAGVAAAEALAGWVEGGQLRLKWPNDVMLDGGKVAGVLAEAGLGGEPWLVLGFGVNVVAAPEGLGRQVACLGGGVGAEALADAVVRAVAGWRGAYEAGGFAPVRDAWLALGHRVGERVRTSRAEGVFLGLTDDGAMRLEVEGVERVVWSGG